MVVDGGEVTGLDINPYHERHVPAVGSNCKIMRGTVTKT